MHYANGSVLEVLYFGIIYKRQKKKKIDQRNNVILNSEIGRILGGSKFYTFRVIDYLRMTVLFEISRISFLF